jgi:manganese/zinc/iron transport system permease protein
MAILHDLLFDYTLRTVALGAIILGMFAGALGSFAVLRKQSLLGDAISHAALPGVALAFMFTLSKNPLVLLFGAILAGWIGTLLVMGINRNTIVKQDAALGIILSVFFGLGIVLLTMIQKMPTAKQAGLETFLFGNASTLLQSDVVIMAILGVIAFALLFLFWKEFKLLSFDPDYAQSLGFPIKKIDVLLTTLIVIAIVVGLQTVGVVLMSAMIIAPAAAARQWTDRLGLMVVLSAFFGAVAGVSGAVTSSIVRNLPTGPTIVLFVSVLVVLSLFFAPHRGLAWDWIQKRVNRKKINMTRLMSNLLRLSESHTDPYYPHDISSLRAINPNSVKKSLKEAVTLGWVKPEGDKWGLTKKGLEEARKLVKALGKEARQ